jgi:hypothetical protein
MRVPANTGIRYVRLSSNNATVSWVLKSVRRTTMDTAFGNNFVKKVSTAAEVEELAALRYSLSRDADALVRLDDVDSRLLA